MSTSVSNTAITQYESDDEYYSSGTDVDPQTPVLSVNEQYKSAKKQRQEAQEKVLELSKEASDLVHKQRLSREERKMFYLAVALVVLIPLCILAWKYYVNATREVPKANYVHIFPQIAQLKSEDLELYLAATEVTLTLDSNNVAALTQKVSILEALKREDEAMETTKKILQILSDRSRGAKEASVDERMLL
jgi:hypothetical protein